MPRRIGETAPDRGGVRAYQEAKALLDHYLSAQHGLRANSHELISVVRDLLARVEERGTELTADEFREIERKVDSCVRGHYLLQAARDGDPVTVRRLAGEASTPVNFQDPRTGATALHYMAAYRARPALRELLKSGRCDFLIRDKKGRLAWELASSADDAAMARLLLRKTVKQAAEQDVVLRRREAETR